MTTPSTNMAMRSTRLGYLVLIFILLNVINATLGRSPDKLTRIRCPDPKYIIPNGGYKLRRNNMIMRIQCREGFELQGPRLVECIRGRWSGDKAVCAKRGCHINIPNPEHGHILMDNEFRMILFCLDNYKLAGSRYAYCNGTHWDREIGNCREPSYNVEHSCDFETDDLCGWVYEETIGTEWKRQTAANVYANYHTGPRHDHTSMLTNDGQTSGLSSGGHYMLMETVMPHAEPGIFLSPVYENDLSLKTACCFQFFYFMYGSGVGELKVYIRPVTMDIAFVLAKDEYLRFNKSGNQNNLWNEAHFKIGELDDDFQIVFVATAGRNHLSDIAIDDVKLMTGEDCVALDKPKDDDEESSIEEVTDEVLIDTQSCRGRCLEETGAGFVRKLGRLYGRCNCHTECEEDETCCPDFRSICLKVIFYQTTPNYENATQTTTIETNHDPIMELVTSTKPPTPLTTFTTPSTTSTTNSTTTSTSTTLSTTTKITSTTSSTTTSTTTTTTTTTRKPTTAKRIPTTTRRITTTRKSTSSTRTTSTTAKPIPTIRTTKKTTTTIAKLKTTPKSTTTTKSTFIWKTTPRSTINTKPTTRRQATSPTTTMSTSTSTSTTLRTTISSTTTVRPTTVIIVPFENSKRKQQPISGKHEIISWHVDNSSKQFKSPANRILLTVLILLVITIAVSTVYYHYKEDFNAWYSGRVHSEFRTPGDVETTSIRAKFRAKTNRISTSSTVMGIKSRLGISSNRTADDMNCLIDSDNDYDNNASISIHNPSALATAKGPKNSISTNL